MQTASKCRIHFKFCVNVMATGHWPACVNIVTLYFVTKTWNNLYEKVLQNRLRIVLCSCQCGMCVQSKACSCSFGNSHFLDTSGICWLSPNNAYKAKAWNWFQVRRWFCNQVRRPAVLPVMNPFAFCLLNLERCSSWHFFSWETSLLHWVMKVRPSLLSTLLSLIIMTTRQHWSWNVPLLLQAETSQDAIRKRSPSTRLPSLQTQQGSSPLGLRQTLSHSWLFRMCGWGMRHSCK